MTFDFRGLLRFTYLWLLRCPWTARRAAVAIGFYTVFPLLELITWLGLLLDEVIFPGYRQQPVRSPVFIIGNFRSGTTFLHRLLALDAQHFSSMKMWEILFAPSIVQRRFANALATLDRRLRNRLRQRLDRIEKRWDERNAMHAVSLGEPEEDDYLLLHAWSALSVGLSAGLLNEASPYARFDQALPTAKRERVMGFYQRCVQRHLYAHRGAWGSNGRQYLAKNPALTPKLETLYTRFPDAKIICLVRSPLEVVPSFLSMMQFTWRVLGLPATAPALRNFVIDMLGHWYRYPLERLARAPKNSWVVVNYDDLVGDPEQTIVAIYERFGFEMSSAFAQVLRAEAAGARRFSSRHQYSLEKLGLTREQVVTEFQDIFDRFGFDRATGDGQTPL